MYFICKAEVTHMSKPARRSARERYNRYINSPAWSDRKRAYFSTYARVCAFCGTTDDIHLHHHTYDRMGRELDEDLVPLCVSCHDAVHDYHRSNRVTLTVATRVVAQGRAVIVKRRSDKRAKDRERRRRKRTTADEKRLVREQQRAAQQFSKWATP
jgi:hypothetical protein